MLNKKKFSFQFLSSEKLHQINFSFSNVLIFFIVFTTSFVSINYLLSQKFSDEYYKVKLKETDEKYSEVSKELLDKIARLEEELKIIEEKDSELRTYATLAPLSDDVKAQGIGGSTENVLEVDKSTLMSLKNRVDSLAFAVNIPNSKKNLTFELAVSSFQSGVTAEWFFESFTAFVPAIRSEILYFMGGHSLEELESSEFQAKLLLQLKDVINKKLESLGSKPDINKVLFIRFVIT